VSEAIEEMTTPERIAEALKAVDYKYFGDYELSESQWDAIFVLCASAKALQALRDECERLRKALEVAGDDICSEFCGSGPCHKKCLAVQAALQPEKERHE